MQLTAHAHFSFIAYNVLGFFHYFFSLFIFGSYLVEKRYYIYIRAVNRLKYLIAINRMIAMS